MVLSRSHGKRLAVRHEGEQRAFRPRHALLDKDGLAGIAELAVEALANCLLGLFDRRSDNDALASRQAVGLHHDGSALLANVGDRRIARIEGCVRRRGDIVLLHERLAVRLAPLEQRACGIGAEDRDTRVAQLIGNTRNKRRLRAYGHKVDTVLAHEGKHGRTAHHVDVVDVGRNRSRAAVTRGNEQLIALRRLGKRPSDRMLATATAKHQNVHNKPFLSGSQITSKGKPASRTAKLAGQAKSQRARLWRVRIPRELEDAYCKYAPKACREQLRRQSRAQRRLVARAARAAQAKTYQPRMMVWSRSGPTATIEIFTPVISSRCSTYFCAFSGSSSKDLHAVMSSPFQPGSSS